MASVRITFTPTVISHLLFLLVYPQNSVIATDLSLSAIVKKSVRCPEECECNPSKKTVQCFELQKIPLISYMQAQSLTIQFSNIPVIYNYTLALANMNNLKILKLAACGIEIIEIDAFSELVDLEILQLIGNDFVEIDVNIFKNNIKLAGIWIHANKKLSKLAGGPFPSLPRLTKLYLESCNLTELRNNTFSELAALEVLRLDGNNFLEIDVNMFTYSIKLTRLDLDSNKKLKELTGGPFPSLSLLTELNLYSCNLTELKNNMFIELVGLQKLKLSGNSFLEIDVNIFRNNVKLNHLFLNSNRKLRRLISGPFPSLPQLTELYLNSCNLTQLENNAFINLASLQKLTLSENNFIEIDVNIFENNKRLTSLWMYSNKKLNKIVGSFPLLPHLIHVYLNDCGLTYFEQSLLNGLVSLETLYLGSNNFTELDVSVFKRNIKLKDLYLSENRKLNKLTGDSFPKLPRLKTLNLAGCNLSELNQNLFSKLTGLERLYLGENNFVEINPKLFQYNIRLTILLLDSNKKLSNISIDPFPSLRQLTFLNLSLSNLSELRSNLFGNLKNLDVLDLSANHFKSLPVNIFRPLGRLRHLHLEENPWHCYCGLRTFWEFFVKKMNSTNSLSNVYCSQPRELSGREWLSLTFEDFGCPLSNTSKIEKRGDSIGVEIKDSPDSSDIKNSVGHTAKIILISVAVTLLIIFGTVFQCFKIRQNDSVQLTTEEITLFQTGNHDVLQNVEDTLHMIENMPYNALYEIHWSRFKLDSTRILGKGNYGIVYKGKYIGKDVAIKTILNPRNVSLKTANEAHTGKFNIVSIIGANTKDLRKGIFLLTEYCELGSLENYLRKHRDKFCSSPQQIERLADLERHTISTCDLTKWAYEIANGMSYVASRRVIHGDIASRNVLLTSQRTAKITDFGLSRRLAEYNTYTKKNKEPLPWRWLAIESLKDLKFSTESDIWSYGITLWEIFSLAQVPYPGLNWTGSFVKSLENGLRPEQPEHATQKIYNIIKQTWCVDPSERLSFDELRTRMRIVLEEFSGQNYECTITLDESVL